MTPIPYDVIDALIQCFGRCFHYKDKMELFLVSSGVNQSLVQRDKPEYKFVWARKLLSDLNQNEEGILTIRRLITEFAKLKNLPDPDVQDRDSGLDALRHLKKLALENKLITEEVKQQAKSRASEARKTEEAAVQRAQTLKALSDDFTKVCIMGKERQKAGYCLERILKELFLLSEIEYHGAYKTETEQIDGYFALNGFSYLVEAKCTAGQPVKKDILAFEGLAKERLQSTRGLFVSVNGFRSEVIQELTGSGTSILLMDGGDLTCLLEGRIGLKEALELKIDHAARTGSVYLSLFTCKL